MHKIEQKAAITMAILEYLLLRSKQEKSAQAHAQGLEAFVEYLGHLPGLETKKPPIFVSLAFLSYCFNIEGEFHGRGESKEDASKPIACFWDTDVMSNALFQLKNTEHSRKKRILKILRHDLDEDTTVRLRSLDKEAMRLFAWAKSGICRWVLFSLTDKERVDEEAVLAFLTMWMIDVPNEIQTFKRLLSYDWDHRRSKIKTYKKKIPWSKVYSVIQRYIACTEAQCKLVNQFQFNADTFLQAVVEAIEQNQRVLSIFSGNGI
ncbi:Pot1 associated protein Poz1 [Schizosaccharomyces japonicus yFS275]|uniref:Pot1 associated protein Poz1 n=1 Tax=Schizosaccharomyces japonicus (strain yFS275 / FY16936) TaxID=402676 RepID=B6JZ40_SCHJY|nr:Pot1 associated protein Poz1 [Schizosaccharomyces japonicus yFS275]EEB06808.2 Pot1 associated protein Poz1 [Schizosaccharomyces japonicus yFS275]